MKDFLKSSLKMLPNHDTSVGGILSQQGDGLSSSKEVKTRKKKDSKSVFNSVLLSDHKDDASLSSLFT